MNSAKIEMSCKCCPCRVDLKALGYDVEWEDPVFAGTQCGWHRHIVGRFGFISPDIDNESDAIFVQFTRRPFGVSSREWADIINRGMQFTVPVSELDHWATLIGVRK